MKNLYKILVLSVCSAFLFSCGNDSSSKNTNETNLPGGNSGGGMGCPTDDCQPQLPPSPDPIPCDKNTPCNYGYTCKNNYCVSCENDDDCQSKDEVCVRNTCFLREMVECSEDNDCRNAPEENADFFCSFIQGPNHGILVDIGGGHFSGVSDSKMSCVKIDYSSGKQKCETRAECRGGVVCLSGYCIGCVDSNQCLSSETCINNRCVQNELIGCRLDSDCNKLGEKAICLVTWNDLTLDEIMKAMLAGTWDMDKDPFDANPATACRAYPEP